MGFSDIFNDVKSMASKVMPPNEEDVKKLREVLDSNGLKKASVKLENFKETEDGPVMQRVAIGGLKNVDDFEKAKKLSVDVVGSRWVNSEPDNTAMAPSIGKNKIEKYRESKQENTKTQKQTVTVGVSADEIKQKGTQAAKDAGNFIGEKLQSFGKFLQDSSSDEVKSEAPKTRRPGPG